MTDVDPNAPLYPLRFRPHLASRIWGGRRLHSVLHKVLPPGETFGESWEVYDFPPGVVDGSADWMSAAVADGPLAGQTLHDLMLAMSRRLMGDAEPLLTPAGPQFPLLIKFLDAATDLSVQVHPTDAYAASHPGAQVKNEAWYVIAADPGARMLIGLKAGLSREACAAALQQGEIEQVMNRIPARAGDFHYLPGGTLHALGGGVLVAEIQTPSDTTFRAFDFNRIDPATGSHRELHVEQALQVIDFPAPNHADRRPRHIQGEGLLVATPQFELSLHSSPAGTNQALAVGLPTILILIDGEARLVGDEFEGVNCRKGETLLIPASLRGHQIRSETGCRWLQAIPRG